VCKGVLAGRMEEGGPRVWEVEMAFWGCADTRQVCVPEHAEQVPSWADRYEVPRKPTRRCSSRRICWAVNRSTTRIGPWQLGHCQTADS
jgi:hypothetical protein